MNKPTMPTRTLLQGKPYRNADATDVRRTWYEYRQELDGPDWREAETTEQEQYEQEQR